MIIGPHQARVFAKSVEEKGTMTMNSLDHRCKVDATIPSVIGLLILAK